MLKFGVTTMAVQQKAKANGLDLDLLEELFDKARKVNPNLV